MDGNQTDRPPGGSEPSWRYSFMAGCGVVLVVVGVFASFLATIIAGVLLLLGAGVGIGAERRRD